MTTTLQSRRAGQPCERCGGQMFWEYADAPLLPRDYRALVCIQCAHVGDERWRVLEPPVIEWPRR